MIIGGGERRGKKLRAYEFWYRDIAQRITRYS